METFFLHGAWSCWALWCIHILSFEKYFFSSLVVFKSGSLLIFIKLLELLLYFAYQPLARCIVTDIFSHFIVFFHPLVCWST